MSNQNDNMSEKRTLADLPGEIQNLIIANLNVITAAALSMTNQYFHRLVFGTQSSREAIKDYLRRIETSEWHVYRGPYACYSCLRMLSMKKHSEGWQGKNGAKRWTRKCIFCHTVVPNVV